MSKTKIIYFLLLFTGQFAFAQKKIFKKKAEASEEEKTSTKTLAYGLSSHNYSGLIGGVIIRSSLPVSSFKGLPVNQYLAVEADVLKNPRESNYYSASNLKFIYGKTHYFFSIRPEYGREFFLFSNENKNSLALSAIFAAGPSFGILKPYYIKYQFPNSSTPEIIAYDPAVATNPNNIVSSSSFFTNMFRGLNFVPGFHVKAALNLDKYAFNNNVTGFELGTVLEIFSKKPEILAPQFSKNQRAFATLYLTVYLGNKKLVKKKK